VKGPTAVWPLAALLVMSIERFGDSGLGLANAVGDEGTLVFAPKKWVCRTEGARVGAVVGERVSPRVERGYITRAWWRTDLSAGYMRTPPTTGSLANISVSSRWGRGVCEIPS
jgi:hypothetical protein